MLCARLVTHVEVAAAERALFHVPTPFPPRLSPDPSLCQDQALQTCIAELSGGEGGKGEDQVGGGLGFPIKIAENSINYKQSGLEGSGTWVAKSKSCSGVVSTSGVERDGAIAKWEAGFLLSPVHFSIPKFAAPWTGQLFNISLCPLVLWLRRCCCRVTWWLSTEAALPSCVLWPRGWRGVVKVSGDPSVPGGMFPPPPFASHLLLCLEGIRLKMGKAASSAVSLMWGTHIAQRGCIDGTTFLPLSSVSLKGGPVDARSCCTPLCQHQ